MKRILALVALFFIMAVPSMVTSNNGAGSEKGNQAIAASCTSDPNDVRLCRLTGGRWNYRLCICEYP
ncbi:MAG: hypothetical protein AB1489_31250 [Acidobacteriota bacterium]